VLTSDGAGGLRARLMVPPVEGAANRALIELVARAFRIRRSDVEILRGERARDKLVAIHGLSEPQVRARMRALDQGDVDNAERRG